MTFQVLENPVTGERVVIRQHGSPENDGLAVADLYARPGAAVTGEHVHPRTQETFTVVRGELGVRIDGRSSTAVAGQRLVVPPGTAHDWWNAGSQTALVIVEVTPDGRRFESMIRNLFFLAADGRTDARGRPGLLQASVLAQEFDDTIRFTSPPRAVQQALFSVLRPIARRRGLRGSDPAYEDRVSDLVEALEDLPPQIAALLPPGVPGATG